MVSLKNTAHYTGTEHPVSNWSPSDYDNTQYCHAPSTFCTVEHPILNQNAFERSLSDYHSTQYRHAPSTFCTVEHPILNQNAVERSPSDYHSTQYCHGPSIFFMVEKMEQ